MMVQNYDYQASMKIYCIDRPWGIKDLLKILSNKSLNKYDT